MALRHQIAVLERSGTPRPCFRLWDRLFWSLFLRWWSQWRNSLIIVQPETVSRWYREGSSGLWRYRSRGRWRGGWPRISNEIRQLIVRMARKNFLWGAPRIHGELLMLGFTVSQATVSRYMPPANRRPGQSWRAFLRNQALAFRYDQDLVDILGRHRCRAFYGLTRSKPYRLWLSRLRSNTTDPIGSIRRTLRSSSSILTLLSRLNLRLCLRGRGFENRQPMSFFLSPPFKLVAM
jgi:hypothetical protein